MLSPSSKSRLVTGATLQPYILCPCSPWDVPRGVLCCLPGANPLAPCKPQTPPLARDAPVQLQRAPSNIQTTFLKELGEVAKPWGLCLHHKLAGGGQQQQLLPVSQLHHPLPTAPAGHRGHRSKVSLSL